MNGSLRIDVPKREAGVVFVNDIGFYLLGHDFVEESGSIGVDGDLHPSPIILHPPLSFYFDTGIDPLPFPLISFSFFLSFFLSFLSFFLYFIHSFFF